MIRLFTGVLAAGLISWALFNLTPEHQYEVVEVKVQEIRTTPEKHMSGSPNLRLLENEKRKKIYTFAYRSDDGHLFNHEEYLRKHPKDAVLIRWSKSEVKEYLTVFSNNPPDPNFFRTKG